MYGAPTKANNTAIVKQVNEIIAKKIRLFFQEKDRFGCKRIV
jgi:hypothetical protein